jgi:GH24 family phage-related lysozyme (muramidase)
MHRILNSFFIIVVAIIASFAVIKVPEYQAESEYQSEISQLMMDEGLRYEPYKDTLGNATIGFGHLIRSGEEFAKLTPRQAIELLRDDYAIAKQSVERRYPWASGDVKLVLTNMSFQLGEVRLAKFKKALAALKAKDYDLAAAEFLDSRWARQAPKRAQRLAGRILQLEASFW